MANYTIDQNRFVSEQFERETVIINLEDGLYYSLSATATEILNLLKGGLSVEEIVVLLSAHYTNKAELPGLVEGFVAEIVKQGIVIPRSPDFQGNKEDVAKMIPANGPDTHFDSPAITRFDDMQEILLLDPIHQVSEQGWPHQ
jgi:hypothetical protein